MAKKSTTAAAKPAASKPTAADKKAEAEAQKAAAAKTKAAESKRAEREKLTAQQFDYVTKHYLDGDESLSAVAKHLNITSGKTAFIAMQVRVERGEVPTITGKNDEALLANIAKARDKADEFSSWGWLAARSGKSEGFIKNGLQEAGLYEPKAENIATRRAEANKPAESTKPAGKKAGKTTGKKAKGNA